MDTNQNQLTTTQKLNQVPHMPSPLAWPVKWMPQVIQHHVIEHALNRFFKQALQDDELAFLDNRVIHVHIKDAYIRFSLQLKQQSLRVLPLQNSADLSLSTDVYTLLQLISQQEDADGLFFSRRLDSQGDTELGLYVKNFLAALDPDESKPLSLGMTMSKQLLHLINLKNRLFN